MDSIPRIGMEADDESFAHIALTWFLGTKILGILFFNDFMMLCSDFSGYFVSSKQVLLLSVTCRDAHAGRRWVR